MLKRVLLAYVCLSNQGREKNEDTLIQKTSLLTQHAPLLPTSPLFLCVYLPPSLPTSRALSPCTPSLARSLHSILAPLLPPSIHHPFPPSFPSLSDAFRMKLAVDGSREPQDLLPQVIAFLHSGTRSQRSLIKSPLKSPTTLKRELLVHY